MNLDLKGSAGAAVVAFIALGSVGCGDDTSSSTSGSGGASGSGGSSTATTSVGGGGEGGGGACVPGAVEPCYSGPAGTEGVGICQAGARTCLSDRTGFGACEGETLPATEVCSLAPDEDCDGIAPRCGGNHLWSKTFGGSDGDQGYGVAVDANGDIVLVSEFRYMADFGGGTLLAAGLGRLALSKYDADGNHLFSRAFAGTEEHRPRGVVVDADRNIYIAGYFLASIDCGGGVLTSAGSGDIFVTKLDPDGNQMWSKRFGDAEYQAAEAIALDPSGNVLVTGTVWGSVDFGGGTLTGNPYDLFVLVLDADGNHVMSRRFGDGGQTGYAIAAGADGSIFVAGSNESTIDLGGGPLTATDQLSGFFAKLAPDGSHLWSRAIDSGLSAANGLAADSFGDVYVTGFVSGTPDLGGGPLQASGFDAFLAKYDSGGTLLWASLFGDADAQWGGDLTLDHNEKVTLVGQYAGSLDLGSGSLPAGSGAIGNIFVGKFEPDGSPLWSSGFAPVGSGFSSSTEVATDPNDGSVVVSGYMGGTVDFGGGALVSKGSSDVPLIKLSE